MYLLLIFPLFLIGAIYIHYKDKAYYDSFRLVRNQNKKGFFNVLKHYLYKYLTPKRGSKIYNFYFGILRIFDIDVQRFFLVKFLMLLCFTLVFFMVKETNIEIGTKVLLESAELADSLYLKYSEDGQSLIENDIEIFRMCLDLVEADLLISDDEEDRYVAIDQIHYIIASSDIKLTEPINTVKVRIYDRLRYYHQLRHIGIKTVGAIMLMGYLSPDIYIYIRTSGHRVARERELKQLRRLFKIKGSIERLTFMDCLLSLQKEAFFYKNIIDRIVEFSSEKNKSLDDHYRELLADIPNLRVKLFVERLQSAQMKNLSAAVEHFRIDIETEEIQNDDFYLRKLRQIEGGAGIAAFLLLSMIGLYGLLPLLEAFSMPRV